MKCKKVKNIIERLSRIDIKYLDKAISEHLDACSSCKEYFNKLSKIEELVKSNKEKLPPAEYWMDYQNKLLLRLKGATLDKIEKCSDGKRLFPRIRVALEVAAVLCILFSFYLIRKNNIEIASLSTVVKEPGVEQPAANDYIPSTMQQEREKPVQLTRMRDFSESKKILNEVSLLFPSGVEWVAVDNGQIEMGIFNIELPAEKAQKSRGPLIFLNFSVFFDDFSTGDRIISSPEISVFNGNYVDMKMNDLLFSNRKIEYQLLPKLVDNKTIKADLRLILSEDGIHDALGEGLELRTSILLREGETVEVGKISSSRGVLTVLLNVLIDERKDVDSRA
jgi:hypothetical protein